MKLPAAIPTVRVTGTYVGPDGRPLKGSVTFTGPSLLTFPESNLFIAGPVVATLDESGQIIDADGNVGVTLPATDSPDMNPSDWAWTVKEALTGVVGTRTYALLLPADTEGGVIDLADVAPADPLTPNYVPVPGPSAYQVALHNGFVGSEPAWIASLKGVKGDTGATGATGSQGAMGSQGATGATGAQGAPGVVQSVNGISQAAVVLNAASVGAVAATNGTVSGTLSVDGVAGSYRPIKLQSGGVDRWQIQNDGTAETGTDTGSNLRIGARHDDGTDNGVALFVRRDNRKIVVNGTSTAGESILTVTGALGVKDIAADPATSAGSAQFYSKGGLPFIKQGDGTVFQVGSGGGSGAVTSVNGFTGVVTLTAVDVSALASSLRGAVDGVASLDGSGLVPTAQLPSLSSTYVAVSTRGAANGVATLDASGDVPIAQIPDTARNAWTPQALGFKAWSCDPGGVANPAAKYLTPQRLYLTGFNITESTTVTKVVLFARGYGGVAADRFMAGIYREDGTRVVASSAVALTMAGQESGALPPMASNHIGAVPLSITSTTLAPGRYWVAWLMTVGAASDFSFYHVQNEAPVATANFFMTTSPFPRAWYLASQSTLPTTVSPTNAAALADHDIPIVALA